MTSGHPTPAALHRLLTRAVVLPPALFAALALVFLGLVAYLLSTAARVDHTDRVIGSADELLRHLVDGETGARGYALSGDPVFLAPYHSSAEQTPRELDELAALVADNPAQGERLATLRADYAGWREYAGRLIGLVRDGGDPQPLTQTQEGKRRMDAMRGRLAEFVGDEVALREDRTRAARTATWVVTGASLVLALLLGALLAARTRQELLGVVASYSAALTAAEERAESLRRSAHRLTTLHNIDRAILTAEPMPGLVAAALRRVADVVPSGSAFVVAAEPDAASARVLGRDAGATAAPAEFADRDATGGVADLGAVTDHTPLQKHLYEAGNRSFVGVPLDSDDRRYGVLVLADPRPAAFSDEHAEVAREVGRQFAIAFRQAEYRGQLERHAADLERRVEERTRELQESLSRVKQLQGLLPICAWCKRVRDDGDYWHQVEHYVAAHSGARFTHGMCPDCLERQMSQLGEDA
ncbi:CHASE3 domain-containing protein [bacterium]|nr:CHASE3 domain-containing protein [bacterium]